MTYGYRCLDCGRLFDLKQRMDEEPITEDPECGGKVERMIYPASFIFKGSGFYATDYKQSGRR